MTKVSDHQERLLELEGWKARLISYRIGDIFHAKVDNVDPGANVARASGSDRDQVEAHVIQVAQERFQATRRYD